MIPYISENMSLYVSKNIEKRQLIMSTYLQKSETFQQIYLIQNGKNTGIIGELSSHWYIQQEKERKFSKMLSKMH